jgi:stage II sporulation protein D
MNICLKFLSTVCGAIAVMAIASCGSAPPPRERDRPDSGRPIEEYIRIAIMEYEHSVNISVQGGTISSRNQTLTLDSPKILIVYNDLLAVEGNKLQLPVTIESPSPLHIDDRPVYGHLIIQDGYFINLLPIDVYVAGVLNGELPSSWPLEVLKAQAVVSRTYAHLRIMQYDDKLFHAGSSELFQKYEYTQSSDAIERAVRDTTNEILLYRNQPIEAFFHACSGGRTENSRDIFQKDLPYLRSIPDPYCAKNERFFWTYTVPADHIAHSLHEHRLTDNHVKSIRDIRIHNRTGSGRAASFSIQPEDQERLIVPGNSMRLAIDSKSFKSLLITRISRHMSGDKTEFTFEGRGYGHGVGMSQWGAKEMADQGFTYRDILGYYYRGTRVGTIWDIR